MATNAQIAANQVNAQHSTGPVTPQGKLASSQNATRHGAYSTKTLIPGEDPAERDKLLAEYIDSCKPAGPFETHAVETMADCKWKLRRLTRIEDATYRLYAITFADELALLPDDPDVHLAYMLQHDAANNKMLQRIPQQEARLHRLYAHSMKELRTLQSARQSETGEVTEEVAKQTQSAAAAASSLRPSRLCEPAVDLLDPLSHSVDGQAFNR